jgi:hypothetical protein
MILKYRIISFDEADFSFTVRYFTDELSEFDLRLDPEDTTDPPLRCRTDYNLNMWRNIDAAMLHRQLIENAPTQWLERKGRVKAVDPNYAASVVTVRAAMGQTYSAPVNPGGVADLKAVLDGLKKP